MGKSLLVLTIILVMISGCSSTGRQLVGSSHPYDYNKSGIGSTASDDNNVNSREVLIRELEMQYRDEIKDKLPLAINHMSKTQVEQYKKNKKISFWGTMSGVAANVLMVASKANVATAALFTGLQTAAFSQLSDNNNGSTNLVNPISPEKLEANQKAISEAMTDYHSAVLKLRQEINTSDQNWNTLYQQASNKLELLRFRILVALPSDEVLAKKR